MFCHLCIFEKEKSPDLLEIKYEFSIDETLVFYLLQKQRKFYIKKFSENSRNDLNLNLKFDSNQL